MTTGERPTRHYRWRLFAGPRREKREWRRGLWPRRMVLSQVTHIASAQTPADPRLGPNSWVTMMCVSASSLDDLRGLLDHPVTVTKVRKLTVIVESWHVPQRGWSGRLGPVPHILHHRATMPRSDHGKAVIELEVRWSVPLRTMISAILPVLTSIRPLPRPVSADITAQEVAPPWVGSSHNIAVVNGVLPVDTEIRAHDLVLSATGEPLPVTEDADEVDVRRPLYGAVIHADPTGVAARAGEASTVAAAALVAEAVPTAATAVASSRPVSLLVDAEHTATHGRYGPFGPTAPRADLHFAGTGDRRAWRIDGPTGTLYAGRTDQARLPEEAVQALAGIGYVRCASLPGVHPADEAALLVRLAMAGFLVYTPGLDGPVAAYLEPELLPLFVEPLPHAADGAFEWEVRAVRQRRAALRQHATAFALPRLAAGAFPALAEPPQVSVLLVTRRLEHLADVLEAAERQTYPNLEIVLCLHGVELTPALRDRVARSPRPVELVVIPPDEKLGFGEAIGLATAQARGSLVTKFDDDDTYGPEHVWDLVLARHFSGATLVGKAAEFVYLHALDTTVRRDAGRSEVYARMVAGGTMLIGRGDLEDIGGWRPVPRSIDRGLVERVARAGGLIYRTHPLGYVYHRRSGGHTWDPGLEYFLRESGAQWPGVVRHAEFGTGPALPSGQAPAALPPAEPPVAASAA